jgi:hypothetical protein
MIDLGKDIPENYISVLVQQPDRPMSGRIAMYVGTGDQFLVVEINLNSGEGLIRKERTLMNAKMVQTDAIEYYPGWKAISNSHNIPLSESGKVMQATRDAEEQEREAQGA